MKNTRQLRSVATALAATTAWVTAPSLLATNGMNMEGYGPIATAMGGASLSYDNGTAAVINNPATLGLQKSNARLDLALGVLGPDITAISPQGEPADSRANAFYMPAAGYTRFGGQNLVYGVGIFGQGGMGCEYAPETWRGLGFDLENRTEVSVGRVIAPLAWKVNDQLTIAGTIDFVWAGMDLKMAMSGAQFMDLIDPSMQNFGRASGGLVQTMGGILQQMPPGTSVDYAYFNYSNGNSFTGEAEGNGWAGKIGVLYEVSDRMNIGFTYHTKTSLSDLSATAQEIAFQLDVPGMGKMPQTLTGNYRVIDFEWPDMLGVGISWRPDDRWFLTADVRRVGWASAMKNFHVQYVASGDAANGPFAGQDLDATLYQDWDDQTVFMAGFSVAATQNLILRFGGNYASNPVPDKYLNCLFPAVVQKHLTTGLGYRFSEASGLDLSITRGFGETITSGYNVTVKHSQWNGQIMYSHRF